MSSKHHTVIIKTLTVSLAVILGLGVFANSSSALFVCSAACCMDRRASVDFHHTPKITAKAPSCCCSDTAAFPCEYTGDPERRLSPPALLRVHQVDHRDLTVDHTDVTAAPAGSPETTGSPAALCFASILKVPIYLSTQTFLC
ncbi:MAG: hypothetical protein P8Y74_03860 [Desulfobacterales bacterium]